MKLNRISQFPFCLKSNKQLFATEAEALSAADKLATRLSLPKEGYFCINVERLTEELIARRMSGEFDEEED